MLTKKLPHLLFLLSFILPLILSYEVFKQDDFIYFDPVSDSKCGESNYWTPFYQTTTCYRWINLNNNDTSKNSTLKIMLDHNIATSTYIAYESTLKKSTSLWKRYNGTVDIIDEVTISNLMKYEKKPTLSSSVSPPYRSSYYYMNSYYVINEKVTNEKGYWTKTKIGAKIYAIDENGNNVVLLKTANIGIRPVIKIKKSLLVKNAPLINIDAILKECTVHKYKHETKLYSNLTYKQLQGFTVTKDKLVYLSSNNNNREKSVMYSYYTKDFKTAYQVTYSTTGHGNGMTYNSKTDKVLVVGPDEYKKVYELNGSTLKKEKEYPISSYPKFNGIGYDYNDDLYIGYTGKKIFMTDTTKMTKKFEWDMAFFETAQDLEYNNGYIFYVTSELGAPNKYQQYSFYTKGNNFVSVYNAKLSASGKPTKNFGKLVCRLYMTGKGELEDVSFRNGNVYLGFATQKIDATYSYTFYTMSYQSFVNKIKAIANKQGNEIFS